VLIQLGQLEDTEVFGISKRVASYIEKICYGTNT
jgi:hypothetical protein